MYICFCVKYPLFLLNFNKTLIFSTDFRGKKKQISNFVTIRLMVAELVHSDRRTDMTKLIVAFGNFANVPKISSFCPHVYLCTVGTVPRTG